MWKEEEEEEEEEEDNIYPNPTHGLVTIYLEGISINEINHLKIYNLIGKYRTFPIINENQVNISDLPSGFYFFTINDITFKVIKNIITKPNALC